MNKLSIVFAVAFIGAVKGQNTFPGNGNAGVGTNNPQHEFDVNGDIKASGKLMAGSTFTIDGPNGTLKNTAWQNAVNRVMYGDVNGILQPLAPGNSHQVLYGNATWGDLPIGVTSWDVLNNNTFLALPGNLGIGTSNPQYKLDVNGDLRVSNNVYVGGGLVTTSTVSASSKINAGDIDVGNNLQVTGSSFVNGTATFGGNLVVGQTSNRGIAFVPPVGAGPGIITIGPSGTGYVDPNQVCNGYQNLNPQTVTQFMDQVIVAAPPVQNGPPQPILKVGAFASTSYLESQSSALTINKGCKEFIYLLGTRVGFGTETPTEKFHFNQGNILVDDGFSSGSSFRMTIRGGQQPGLQIGTNNTTGFDALRIYDQATNTDKFNVKGDGKTTISTTDSPGLTVNTNQGVNFSYNTLLNVNNNLIKAFVVSSIANNPNGQENLTVYGDGRTIIGDQGGLGNLSKLNVNTNGGVAMSITDLQNGNNTFNVSSNGYTEIKVFNAGNMPAPAGGSPRALTIRDMANQKDLFVVNATGKAYAREVEINLTATFPDYVFDKEYKLSSLTELDAYIKKFKHLPHFETGNYYEKNGINVSDLILKQQQTIEEQTLYIISLEKRLTALEEKIK